MNEDRSTLLARLENWLDDAGLALAVEEDAEGGAIVLTGLVSTEEEREAACDIARQIVGDGATLEDNITVTGALPAESGGATLSESEIHGFRGATADLEDEESLDAGDYTDQHMLESAQGSQSAALSDAPSDMDDVAEDGDRVYVPPIDPGDDHAAPGDRTAATALDRITGVERSSDGTIGDEALHDAVLRALQDDRATEGLRVTVTVLGGVVRLTGRVDDLVDAENAEEVVSRVPGVVEVLEDLRVEGLERHERRA